MNTKIWNLVKIKNFKQGCITSHALKDHPLILQAIINKLKGGRAMGHCTASYNLSNKPGNPEEYYDGNLHGYLDGGILAQGLIHSI